MQTHWFKFFQRNMSWVRLQVCFWPRYGDFTAKRMAMESYWKMAASSSWIYCELKFKLGRNQSVFGRDMAYSRICKMATAAMLKIWRTHRFEFLSVLQLFPEFGFSLTESGQWLELMANNQVFHQSCKNQWSDTSKTTNIKIVLFCFVSHTHSIRSYYKGLNNLKCMQYVWSYHFIAFMHSLYSLGNGQVIHQEEVRKWKQQCTLTLCLRLSEKRVTDHLKLAEMLS